jgi:phenol hydroxylase P5 protein
MAKVTFTPNEQTEEVADGAELREVCEEKFNIPFGCKDGICGTCRIRVTEGDNNLSPKNEKETDMLPDHDNERLACQAQIKSGKIVMDDGYE